MLEKFGHGGDMRTAKELYRRASGSFTDFSSNMNPLGPPDMVRGVIAGYASRIHEYPDPAARGLRRKLALHHGVPESSIAVGNGAAELIELAVRTLQPRLTALAMPCFSEYADAVRKIDGAICELPLREATDFVPEEARLLSLAERLAPSLFLLGSPNNPTGKLVPPSLSRRLLDSGANVIVDEAFIDFVANEAEVSLAQEAATSERLLVIRSMTKFYAIPGIRLGYAIGRPELIDGMLRLQTPWSVNSLAQMIGEAVLEDDEFRRRTTAWLPSERSRLQEGLRGLGCVVYEGAANYVLFQLPQERGLSASLLQREMGERGILIRDASHFGGLDSRFVRVAVKLPAQNDLLLEQLASSMAALQTGRS